MADRSAALSVDHHEVRRARREKVSMAVARSIVREIAERKLEAGSTLPPEQVMAQQYGVGRTTVREALRLLEAQGLVVVRPGIGGGPVVGSPSGSDFGQTMTMFLQVSGTPLGQVLEAVVHFESVAAALAATRVADGSVTAAEVNALVRASRRDLSTAGDDHEFIETGGRFHEFVRDLASNRIVTLVAQAVDHVFVERAPGPTGGRFAPGQRKRTESAHRKIADAIRQGKPDLARRLMHEHMQDETGYVTAASPGLLDELIEWR